MLIWNRMQNVQIIVRKWILLQGKINEKHRHKCIVKKNRNMKKLLLFGFLNLILSFNQANAQDWRNYLDHTNFKKYQEANEKLLPPAQSDIRVVFMGN